MIVSILAFIVAGGGYYGGYYVNKIASDEQPGICHNFDQQVHGVERIIDGDTIEISGGYIIRLMGIDSPEKGECYYEESSQALAQAILGQEIILQKGSRVVDDHGRLLRYVFNYDADATMNNKFINDVMIKEGNAIPYLIGPDRRYEALLKNSLAIAKRKEKGMHKVCGEDLDIAQPESPECIIKGNISNRTGEKIYYLPGCLNYEKLLMNKSDGDQYFCSEEEAQTANFRKAKNCKE